AGDRGQQAGAEHLVPAVVLDLEGVLRVLLDERVADPGRPLADRHVRVLGHDLAGPDDDLRVALADRDSWRGGRRWRGGGRGGRGGGRSGCAGGRGCGGCRRGGGRRRCGRGCGGGGRAGRRGGRGRG